MDIPIDEVVLFDALTHSPTTGAATDADSAPTLNIYEDTTDTAIGNSPITMTKRTSLTGNYRATETLSAANGFEDGKWYVAVASGTVGAIAGKAILKTWRCVAVDVPGLITTLSAKIDSDHLIISSDTLAIEADTNELQTDDVPGLITTLSTKIDSDHLIISSDTLAIEADTNELQTDDVPGLITTLSTKIDSDHLIISSDTLAIEADTNELQSDDVPGLITTLSTKIDSDHLIISSDTLAIEADTNELQTDDVPGLISTLSTKIDSDHLIISSDTLAIEVDTGTTVPAKMDSDVTLILAQHTKTQSDIVIIDDLLDTEIPAITSNLVIIASDTLACELGIVISTTKAGTLSTTQSSTNLTEATDDHYIGRILTWTSGVLLGQSTDITDYTGVNGVVTYTACTEAAGAGDSFKIT